MPPMRKSKKQKIKKRSRKVCVKCNQFLPAEYFSKKRLCQRNPKNLICLACLGRQAAGKDVKRECSECGKMLSRKKFSKTQWSKRSLGECTSCVERKNSRKVICQKCHQPKAYPGYTICRDCHGMGKILPGGVRFGVPNYLDSRFMSFVTTTIDRDKLSGTYKLIYFCLDENNQSECTISSTAKGQIILRYSSEDDNRLQGSIQFAHAAFAKRVASICSFHSVKASNENFFTSNKSFFSSHIHDFAPKSTWHDPLGDLYINNGSDSPGKLKVLTTGVSLFLDTPCRESKQKIRNKSSNLEEAYKDVTNYWICRHMNLPDDVGRMIRKYVCPPPLLRLLPGDIFLVTTIKRGKKFNWPEIILVGRKE